MEEDLILDFDLEFDNENIVEVDDLKETEIAFPLNSLHESIRNPILDLVRLHGVDPDLPGMIALGTISAALGKGLRLKTPRFLTPPNLYCLASAPSGTGKSMCFSKLMAPIFNIEHRRIDEYNKTQKPHVLAEKELLEAKVSKLKRGSKHGADELNKLKEYKQRLLQLDQEIDGPRLRTADITVQQLALMLSRQNETIACLTSEAGELISIMLGRYNKNERTDEHLFLQAFSLESHTQDRVQREPVILYEPCMSITAVCTPDEVENLFAKDRFVRGGLLPRYLMCRSRSHPQMDDGSEVFADDLVWQNWDKLVEDLVHTYHDAESYYEVKCSKEANQIFSDIHNDFVSNFKIRPEMNSFACRLREQATKVSLCLHGIRYGKSAHLHELSLEDAETASSIVNYFSKTTDSYIAASTANKDNEDFSKIIGSMDAGEVSIRDLKRRGIDFDRIQLLVERYSDRIEYDEVPTKGGGPRKRVVRMRLPI